MRCVGDVVYSGKCVRGREVTVLDCKTCGFKHLVPLPSEEEMAAYYRDKYFSEEKPNYAETSGTTSEYQFLVDQEKIEFAQPFEGAILDFGCGPNAPFLRHWVRQRSSTNLIISGPALYGVEPTFVAPTREHSKVDVGHGVSATMFNSIRRCPKMERYDVIHLGFVLEHVVDPLKTVWELSGLLRAGGRMIIEVPNDFNLLQMILWDKQGVPWWVSSPDHLIYWNIDSLTALLFKAGLVRMGWGLTFPVEMFIAQGFDYRTDPQAAKAVVESRARAQSLWKKMGDSRPTVHSGVGRTVWVVARKQEIYP